MMNELVTAAKASLGLRALWLDDEEYEIIINAVLMKVAGYDENDVKMLALASSDRLNRLLRICREIKWDSFGQPAMKDNATRAAMHELAAFVMQDALDRKSEAAMKVGNGIQTQDTEFHRQEGTPGGDEGKAGAQNLV
jgi:hypothetical protein